MDSPLPQFGEQDWNRIDFSRWNMDGLKIEGLPKMLAGLAQKLFSSPEWRQHFTSTLPAMKQAVLDHFEKHAETLATKLDDNARVLNQRRDEAEKRSEAMHRLFAVAAAPPVLAPDPDSFQLAARILDQGSQLGLPRLQIRLIDTRQEERILAEAVTDLEGNAILVLTKDQALEQATGKTGLTIEVRSLDGKVLHKAEEACQPQPNRVQTWITTLHSTRALKPNVEAAAALKMERETRLKDLAGKVGRLEAHYDAVRQDTENQLLAAKNMTKEIQRTRAGEKEPFSFARHSEAKPQPASPKATSASKKPAGARPKPSNLKSKPAIASRKKRSNRKGGTKGK